MSLSHEALIRIESVSRKAMKDLVRRWMLSKQTVKDREAFRKDVEHLLVLARRNARLASYKTMMDELMSAVRMADGPEFVLKPRFRDVRKMQEQHAADMAAVLGQVTILRPGQLNVRADLSVTSVVAQAFNQEREELLSDIEDLDVENTWVPLIGKSWDATLDAKTCEDCKSLDGTIVPIGLSFPDEQIPGEVHPRCRCIEVIVALPLPLRQKAA